MLANFQHYEHHINKSIRNNPSTRKIVTHHFSAYAATLSQPMTKNDISTMITSPSNQYKCSVTILFNSNNNNSTYETPPKQKCKLQTDTSIIKNTTEECNTYHLRRSVYMLAYQRHLRFLKNDKQTTLKNIDIFLSKLHVICPENLYNNIINNSPKSYPSSTRIAKFNSEKHALYGRRIESSILCYDVSNCD